MSHKGLFVGLATIDLVYLLSGTPAENLKTRASKFSTCAGGPSLNSAITYSILGGKSTFMSALGAGTFTPLIQDEMTKFNVKYIDLSDGYKGEPCVASIGLNKKTGSRTIWSAPLAHGWNPQVIEKVDLSDYDFVMFDGYNMEFSIALAAKAKEQNIPVFFDAGSWKQGTNSLLNYCHCVIASLAFKSPNKTVKQLIIDNDIPYYAITADGEEIRYFDNLKQDEVTPPNIGEVIDTLGAGDVYHGAFAWFFYTQKLPFKDSLFNAAQVASNSIQYYGPRNGVLKWAKDHKS